MPKTAIKKRARARQSGRSAKTGEILPSEDRLVDTHRATPKKLGGGYEDQNTTVVLPPEHMEEHGTRRIRDDPLTELKALMDDRRQVMRVHQKVQNQLLAYERHVDDLNPSTEKWLMDQAAALAKDVAVRTKTAERWMKDHYGAIPIAKAAMGVDSVGPVTVATMLVYVDLTKADHASSLWAYTGLDKASHERYTKGEAGGGNKTLRTALYVMAESQVKGRGAYREVYDRTKSRLEVSEKITKSRNTQGKLIECMWKDTKPCHRHGAALRAIMKAFLADYWFVGRELLGLPTNPLYAEAILGMDGHRTADPKSRGWKW